MDKKRVALYIRVSSEEQKEEGLSLKAQENSLVEYCENKGYVIYRIYKDEGKSAKSISGRNEFKLLLSDADDNKFSGVVVTKFDRAFRNVKDSLEVLDKFANLGIDFISLKETIDTTTPFGRAIFTIISLFAQLERDLTSDRNKAIMQDKITHGLPAGKVPFGYKAVYKNKKEKKGIIGLEIHKKNAEIVLDCFKMASEGHSYKEICLKYSLKPQSYYNLIRNKVYCGIVEFNNITSKASFEPIVSEELFELANSSFG